MTREPTIPVEHPGTFIREELEARGWEQVDLAYILGMSPQQLSPLLNGKQRITPDMATALGDAFDVPAEFFANLQKLHDLSKAKKADPGVRTRAAWQSVFPVREMINRGWIEDAEPDLLHLQMMRFFEKSRVEEVPFISDAPVIQHAARKSSPYDETTPVQYAWLHRVRKVALSMECPPYSEKKLRDSLPAIRSHMMDKEDLIHIPGILKECGVRLVLVEALSRSKLDGVCVWLDGQPVVGMTLRLDRLDNFCFVLRHELEHVLRGDGRKASFAPIDTFDCETLNATDLPECERVANAEAGEFCVPRALLNSFVLRKSPYISEKDVLAFATRVQIHPAVVVGQIQNKTKKYGWLRKYQTSIKNFLLDWEFKDGWGYQAPTGL